MNKAWRFFIFLQQNCSEKSTAWTDLNGCMVMLYLSWRKQHRLVSRENINEGPRMRTEKKTTRWIFNGQKQYKERLVELKLLPISMYMEQHNAPVLLAVIRGYYALEGVLPKMVNIELAKNWNLRPRNIISKKKQMNGYGPEQLSSSTSCGNTPQMDWTNRHSQRCAPSSSTEAITK